ncbi:PfkB family carbohydrate kinase [Shumkonia mesophila]|uniref:PfkB family carbohydrate kinase n=1 Tax=Shumkonia mesophila TaxID=2838854 RepID=UPI002934FD35|nr:PfkB family carbohydrate kinase [Shumkonia mesophila]
MPDFGGELVGRGKQMIAVGAICATAIYRVEQIKPAPAKIVASELLQVVDGMALSAAFAFVKLGGSARIYGVIGDDEQGHRMAGIISSEGVNADGLHLAPGSSTSQVAVIVDGHGDRLVVPFHDQTTDRSAGWLPVSEFAGAGLVHCDVRWPEGAEVALTAARRMGIPSMIDGDVAAPDILHRLVPLADYAVFSDAGLAVYSGIADVEAALKAVAAEHQGHVGASCGRQGYMWMEDGAIRHVPAPSVSVVDTLSAGDVFHGAFARALLEGWSLEASASFACCAASLKCTQFGGRLGCPTWEEVDAFRSSVTMTL